MNPGAKGLPYFCAASDETSAKPTCQRAKTAPKPATRAYIFTVNLRDAPTLTRTLNIEPRTSVVGSQTLTKKGWALNSICCVAQMLQTVEKGGNKRRVWRQITRGSPGACRLLWNHRPCHRLRSLADEEGNRIPFFNCLLDPQRMVEVSGRWVRHRDARSFIAFSRSRQMDRASRA